MDFRGAAVVHVEGPLRDVEVVGAHVRQGAAGIFTVIAPRREVIVDARGTQHVVKRARRRRGLISVEFQE